MKATMPRTFVPPGDYDGRNVTVSRWQAPEMEPGAPMPAVMRAGDDLFVAYARRNPDFPGWDRGASPDHPGFDVYSAVLRFENVTDFFLGPPNDESLHLHSLYAAGLEAYGFFEVHGSPKATADRRHWILCFHDETLEVIGERVTVVDGNVPGEDTADIVRRFASGAS